MFFWMMDLLHDRRMFFFFFSSHLQSLFYEPLSPPRYSARLADYFGISRIGLEQDQYHTFPHCINSRRTTLFS